MEKVVGLVLLAETETRQVRGRISETTPVVTVAPGNTFITVVPVTGGTTPDTIV